MSQNLFLGIDVGSISVKGTVLNGAGTIIEATYKRHFGQPIESVVSYVRDIQKKYPTGDFAGVAITGTAGNIIAEVLGAYFCNEIIAVSRGVGTLYPELRTIIEIGGEDSKLIKLKPTPDGSVFLEDFAMNSACAAGTGSFLDQQASRLQINIENEFSELALQSKNPPRIAGRCSVFAKSDMIHLQQIGTPDYDIVAGLCYAVARNFQSSIAKGKEFVKPIAFIGGVASNKGMVRAFQDILELSDGELIIPKYFTCLGAIGAAYSLVSSTERYGWVDIEKLERYDKSAGKKNGNMPRLTLDISYIGDGEQWMEKPTKMGKIPAYIGIDIGSVSTNVVVISENRKVLARQYLPTAGRPIEAVKKGLKEIGEEISDRIDVRGVGTTGSGRYMIADLVGADIVRNEITAQARAAIEIDPTVDTIFEIGGQDSKYISIDNGVVVNFAMNKVCAAGTGSFLEEQAEQLNINIKREFETIAQSCLNPLKLGERCTVFIESDLITQQQAGASKEELVSGLAYSIARNYLNRVVDKGRIGNNIFFQGGTANNKAVVAAFEKILNKRITVPPHNDVTGAIGIAIIAQERNDGSQSRWKGFGFVNQQYKLTSFICKSCSNLCEIKCVKIENEKPLFYGSRCERFDYDKVRTEHCSVPTVKDGSPSTRGGKDGEHLPDLFDQRERLLLGPFYDRKEKGKGASLKKQELPPRKKGEIRVGIPRALQFYEHFPFWRAFFESLGWTIILSDRTNKDIIHTGVALVTGEFCFPIKVAFGHLHNLLKRDIDFVFLPSFISQPKSHPEFTNSYNCPFVQSIPYIVWNIIETKQKNVKVLDPHLQFQKGNDSVEKELRRVFRKHGVSTRRIRRAFQTASEAQKQFYAAMQELGREVLSDLKQGKYRHCWVIVGRSYNTSDDGMNSDIPKKMNEMGVLAVPMDCLPVEETEIWKYFPNTYWKSGQRILGTGEFLKHHNGLFSLYITNFGCGPDSMITHLYKEVLGDMPYLQIEIDEHSADAGIKTRLEAYMDSLDSIRGRQFQAEINVPPLIKIEKDVTIYIPQMCNHAFPFASVLRSCGIKAEVLPAPTDESTELGRQFTNGKECFPCIVTMGDILTKAKTHGFDQSRSAFYVPTASGPCRFGKYTTLHKLALRDIGFSQIPFFSPNSENSYTHSGWTLDDKFPRKGWISIVVTDLMEKLLHEIRPYEMMRGAADAIFSESLKKVCDTIEQNRMQDLYPILEEYKQQMINIPQKNGSPRIVIGMVGEIFLRLNRYSNADVIRKLEELGAEVRLAPMAEWIFYTNNRMMEDLKEQRKIKELLVAFLKDFVQTRIEHKIAHPLRDFLRYHYDPPVRKILKNSAPYLHSSFGGEAILSVGKAIDYIQQGVNGIVNVMPFTCMPGMVVTALSKKLRQDFDNIPWLNLSYDGQQDDINVRTRLETFVYQARQFTPKSKKR